MGSVIMMLFICLVALFFGAGCLVQLIYTLGRLKRTSGKAILTVMLIDNLRKEQGSGIDIFCDNENDFGTMPTNAIEIKASWTNWEPKRFYGNTLTEALAHAYIDSGPLHPDPTLDKAVKEYNERLEL